MNNEPPPPAGAAFTLGPAIKALRPKQWSKNVLVLVALVFSFHFTSPDDWLKALIAFAVFCLLSSTGYLINDIRDRDADRLHPTKCQRPIASGALSVRAAWIETALMGTLSLTVAASLGWPFFLVACLYFATTMSYSFFFKHIVILDVMFLTTGFLWRAVAGAVAIDVDISPWFLLCTAFLALFLGFNKRRGELSLLDPEKAGGFRKNLSEYSPGMIRDFQAMTTSGTVISYALYTVSDWSPTPWLLITLPYVLYGIFRYIYLVDQKGGGSAPDETLVKDRPILVTVMLYSITVFVVLVLNLVGVV